MRLRAAVHFRARTLVLVGVLAATALNPVAVPGASATSNEGPLVDVSQANPPSVVATIPVEWDSAGIDADDQGGVYVASPTNSTVRRYDRSGAQLMSFFSGGAHDVAVGSAGALFVLTAPRVQERTANGTYVRTFQTQTEVGRFVGIDVDATGDVDVVENTATVCRLYYEGICLDSYEAGADRLHEFNPSGTSSSAIGLGQLDSPTDVAAHGDLLHVADWGNDRIATFTRGGTFVRSLPVDHPRSVATSPDGTLYVLTDHMVRTFAPDGSMVGDWFTGGEPKRIAVDANGAVYVLLRSTAQGSAMVHVYEPKGSISGTVSSGTDGGGPVPGAWVVGLRLSDFGVEAATIAGPDGSFDLSLTGGGYALYVIDPSGRHQPRMYGSPSPVSVAGLVPAVADTTLDPTRGAIAGTITEVGSGAPLAGVSVLALSPSGEAQRGAVTDAQGHYELGDLTEGSHRLAAVHPAGGHVPIFLPDSPTFLGATPVAVTGGQTASADGTLPTQAAAAGGTTLTGTITEDGTGSPLGGVKVVALRSSDFRFIRAGVTAPNGTYSLDVPTDSYKVGFVPLVGGHRQAWHADQPFHGLGDAAAVASPATVDAQLDPTGGVLEGTVTLSGGGAAGSAWVMAIGPNGQIAGTVTAADGTFRVVGLAPGAYRIVTVDPTGIRAPEFWQDATTLEGATPVAVTAGTTVGLDPVLG